MNTPNLIDEDTYTQAIQAFDFVDAAEQPGSHEWARALVGRYLSIQSARRRNDGHLGRMVQQVRSYLQDNQPVMAWQYMNTIRDFLQKRGDI